MANGLDWSMYNGQSYAYGFGSNSLSNQMYYNAGNIADAVYNDSKTIWEREDSAYQRMVADMQKAGLNPWTGISSGGSSTSSTNPSLDSLSSLISVLGGVLRTEDTFTRSSSNLHKMITKAFEFGLNAVMSRLG